MIRGGAWRCVGCWGEMFSLVWRWGGWYGGFWWEGRLGHVVVVVVVFYIYIYVAISRLGRSGGIVFQEWMPTRFVQLILRLGRLWRL
jgi:hypothetical protein